MKHIFSVIIFFFSSVIVAKVQPVIVAQAHHPSAPSCDSRFAERKIALPEWAEQPTATQQTRVIQENNELVLMPRNVPSIQRHNKKILQNKEKYRDYQTFLANIKKGNIACPGCNLSGLSFRGRWFNNADFRCANLSNCDFQNARLAGADFRGAQLQNAQFDFCSLPAADFTNADLSQTTTKQSTFGGATGPAQNGNLVGVCFDGANLTNVTFSNSNLTGASFKGAFCKGTTFLQNTILRCADFYNARELFNNSWCQLSHQEKELVFSRDDSKEHRMRVTNGTLPDNLVVFCCTRMPDGNVLPGDLSNSPLIIDNSYGCSEDTSCANCPWQQDKTTVYGCT